MIRPMASNVSTLSSYVANSHQTIHLVSSAPSKIPYGGFFPSTASNQLNAAATFADAFAHAYRLPLFVSAFSAFIRRRTCVQTALSLPTRTAGPVALGSLTGYIVRPAHPLLWPHLRL